MMFRKHQLIGKLQVIIKQDEDDGNDDEQGREKRRKIGKK